MKNKKSEFTLIEEYYLSRSFFPGPIYKQIPVIKQHIESFGDPVVVTTENSRYGDLFIACLSACNVDKLNVMDLVPYHPWGRDLPQRIQMGFDNSKQDWTTLLKDKRVSLIYPKDTPKEKAKSFPGVPKDTQVYCVNAMRTVSETDSRFPNLLDQVATIDSIPSITSLVIAGHLSESAKTPENSYYFQLLKLSLKFTNWTLSYNSLENNGLMIFERE